MDTNGHGEGSQPQMDADGRRSRTEQARPPQPVTIYWIDPRDHLPDDETTVLLAMSYGEVEMGWHGEGEWRLQSAALIEGVRYWADIPEVPK